MSQSETEVRCIAVWPKLIRLSHWFMAAGVLFLYVSAWLVGHSNVDPVFWLDYHFLVGQVMILVLGVRAWSLWQKGVGHWRSFKFSAAQLDGAAQMLKFYLSFFRLPLPSWYAYNPLWVMVYPLMLVLVLMAVSTGLLHDSQFLVLGYSMIKLHAISTMVLFFVVLLHIATAILHDSKGRGASISAMLNGYRYFHIDQKTTNAPRTEPNAEIRVSIDRILKSPPDWSKKD